MNNLFYIKTAVTWANSSRDILAPFYDSYPPYDGGTVGAFVLTMDSGVKPVSAGLYVFNGSSYVWAVPYFAIAVAILEGSTIQVTMQQPDPYPGSGICYRNGYLASESSPGDGLWAVVTSPTPNQQYVLPAASSEVMGGVLVGQTLMVDSGALVVDQSKDYNWTGQHTFADRPVVNGNAVWDKGNFDPTQYLALATGGTVRAAVTAVSFQSYGGASDLSDAGISTPNVITGNLAVSGPASFTQSPTVNGHAVLDASSLNVSKVLLSDGSVSVEGALSYDGTGTNFRGMTITTGGVTRWQIGINTNESGTGNGGGDLRIYASSDNGTPIGTVATLIRATQQMQFNVRPQFGTAIPYDTANLPSPAVLTLTGSPHYVYVPLLKNAQVTAGIGAILYSFIIPRAMTLSGAQAYADTAPAGSPDMYLSQNGGAYTGNNQLTFLATNKGNLGSINMVCAAGDRIDLVMGTPENTVGSMDNVRIVLIFTLN